MLIFYLNSHNYQALKKDGLFDYFSSCFLQENLIVTQASPGKDIQMTNDSVCQLFNTCNSCRSSSHLQQVYNRVVLLRNGIYFKHCLERLVCSWSSFKSWHSEQDQSRRLLAPCLNLLLCLVQLDSNIQNMPVRREGQSFGNYINHILEVIFAVSSLSLLWMQKLRRTI